MRGFGSVHGLSSASRNCVAGNVFEDLKGKVSPARAEGAGGCP